MYRTGGGPSNAPEFNKVEGKVLSICSNIKGLEARYDSDTITKPTLGSEFVLLDSMEKSAVDTAEKNGPTQAQELNITQAKVINTNKQISKIPGLDESLILDINGKDNDIQKENKWDGLHPMALKTRVLNVLKADTVTKASDTSTFKLDKLSAARMELVELQIETARKEHQFMVEEHKLKMLHLANDEQRKLEIHRLLHTKSILDMF